MNRLDKYLRIIWLVNGVILLVLALIGFGGVIVAVVDSFGYSPRNQDGLVVTENGEGDDEVIKAYVNTFQGLEYDHPLNIPNSDMMYLPLRPKTYKKTPEMAKAGYSSIHERKWNSNYMNIIFLNNKYEVQNVLLNKKATINDMNFPTTTIVNDTTLITKHIAYTIGFKDTNGDGKLNDDDHHDLYISDVNGKNLKQITEDLKIVNHDFVMEHKKIFITYEKLEDQEKEYQPGHFALYDIEKGKLNLLTDIDNALQKLQKELSKGNTVP